MIKTVDVIDQNRAYICDWFPRTKAHLSELYEYFSTGHSHLPLDDGQLKSLYSVLDIESVTQGFDQLEYVELKTRKNKINGRIYADGLIVVSKNIDGSINRAMSDIEEYYNERLNQAFAYLFSTGAPLGRYQAGKLFTPPRFVVLLSNQVLEIDKDWQFSPNEEETLEIAGLNVFRRDNSFLLNAKAGIDSHILRDLIESEAFLYIVEEQLHSFIDLHREVWTAIDKVKEQKQIIGSEVSTVNQKLAKYSKMVSVLKGRLRQINLYVETRKNLLEDDRDHDKVIPKDLLFSYESLTNMVEYTQGLWDTTESYLNSIVNFLNQIEVKAASSSVTDLTIVTSVGVGAAVIGLFTKTPPSFTRNSMIYLAILALFGYIANLTVRWFYRKKKYRVDDLG